MVSCLWVFVQWFCCCCRGTVLFVCAAVRGVHLFESPWPRPCALRWVLRGEPSRTSGGSSAKSGTGASRRRRVGERVGHAQFAEAQAPGTASPAASPAVAGAAQRLELSRPTTASAQAVGAACGRCDELGEVRFCSGERGCSGSVSEGFSWHVVVASSRIVWSVGGELPTVSFSSREVTASHCRLKPMDEHAGEAFPRFFMVEDERVCSVSVVGGVVHGGVVKRLLLVS